MTISRIIAIILPLALFFVASIAFAQISPQEYLLVDDLPFVENATNVGEFLSGIFRLGIGIAVTAAIFMIVFGGIKYMFSDVPGIKFNAKADITNALWGLVLVLASWLILYTINPDLVRFKFFQTLQNAAEGVKAPETTPGGGVDTTKPCAGCVTVPTSLPSKPVGEACKPIPGACMLESGFIQKLIIFNSALRNVHDISWQITESYPPTVTHRNTCHNNGTCVDATTSTNASTIKTFIEEASAKGMTACYEIPDGAGAQTIYDELKTRGVPESNMVILSGITGRHFSLYGYSVSCKR